MDNFNVIAQRIQHKSTIIPFHILLPHARLAVIRRASLSTHHQHYSLLTYRADLHGDLIPLIHMRPILTGKGYMDWCNAVLQLAVILLKTILATAAEPKVRT